MADLPSSVEELNRTLQEMNRLLGIRNQQENDAQDIAERRIVNLREETELQKQIRLRDEAIEEAKKEYTKAIGQASASLKQFRDAVTDNATNLTRYSGATNSLIDAIGTMAGAKFPAFKGAIETATKATQWMAEKVLKQTENMVKAFDDIASMGGGASLTAERIADFGKQAGFTTHNLHVFTQNAKNAGSSLAALGGSTSKGLEAFAKFTDIGEEQVRKYRLLGLTQDQLIEMQTKYMEQQVKTGAAMSKTPEELKKSSLGYINNMLALAELTGKDLKQQEEAYQQAMAQENYNAYKFDQERKRNEILQQARAAGEAGDTARQQQLIAEADKMTKAIEQKDLIATMAKGIGGKVGQGLLEMAASEEGGVYTEGSAAVAMLGIQPEEYFRAAQESKLTPEMMDKFRQQVAQKGMEASAAYGSALYGYGGASRDLQQTLGLENSMREYMAAVERQKQTGESFTEALENVKKTLETGEKAVETDKGVQMEKDRVMATQATVEATQRFAKRLEDTVVEALNPFRTDVEKAAIAAGLLAAAAGMAGVALQNLPGMLAGKAGAGGGFGAGAEAAQQAGKGPAGPGGGGGGIRGALGKLATRGLAAGAGHLVGMAGSAAADALGRDTPLGMGATVLGYAGQGAGYGALGGVPGAALGAIIGTGYGLYKAFQARDEAQQKGGAGAGGDVNDDEVKKMIEMHEGKRNRPYQDSLGKWTVGIGHLIGDGSTLPPDMDRTFTEEEIQTLFDKDYRHHKAAAEKIEGYDKFNAMGKAALIDLTFNMGPSWVTSKGFKRFEKAAREGDAALAAQSLQESKWFEQVGNRGPTIVGMVSKGISAADGGIASGPMSGYPATLHGNEMIQPLDPNSILETLATTPVGQESAKLMNTAMGGEASATQMMSAQSAMIEVMAAKLDSVIAQLEISNDIQDKMYKYASS